MTSISENTQKLLDEFRGERNEIDRVYALYQATEVLPELRQVYCASKILTRYSELVRELVDDMEAREA